MSAGGRYAPTERALLGRRQQPAVAARHGNRVTREQSNLYMTGQLLDHTLTAANASAGISASNPHKEQGGGGGGGGGDFWVSSTASSNCPKDCPTKDNSWSVPKGGHQSCDENCRKRKWDSTHR